MTRDHCADDELTEALGRLRWVVPGRDYSPQLIADVETVLRHFGMANAHALTPQPEPISATARWTK
jgi:hypothetical protein